MTARTEDALLHATTALGRPVPFTLAGRTIQLKRTFMAKIAA